MGASPTRRGGAHCRATRTTRWPISRAIARLRMSPNGNSCMIVKLWRLMVFHVTVHCCPQSCQKADLQRRVYALAPCFAISPNGGHDRPRRLVLRFSLTIWHLGPFFLFSSGGWGPLKSSRDSPVRRHDWSTCICSFAGNEMMARLWCATFSWALDTRSHRGTGGPIWDNFLSRCTRNNRLRGGGPSVPGSHVLIGLSIKGRTASTLC